MFDFFVRDTIVKNAQAFIDRLTPKVDIHIPKDLPFPSVSLIKKMSVVVSKINAMESTVDNMTDEKLRNKTEQFKRTIAESARPQEEEVLRLEKLYREAATNEEKEQLNTELGRARNLLKEIREKTLESILPEAFAMVREAGRRTVGMRHFDVQLIGGMVLHQGKISEMATGEGKTLGATLPAYLNALA